MKLSPEDRAKDIALYIVETGCTVRQAARFFGVSKSTVHTDITVRLGRNEPELYDRGRKVRDVNKEERHIRGGVATREKFKGKNRR